jgi:hypothetical protein
LQAFADQLDCENSLTRQIASFGSPDKTQTNKTRHKKTNQSATEMNQTKRNKPKQIKTKPT